MPIRVIVNGAGGRMGRVTVNMLERDAQFELVGQASRHDDLSQMIQAAQADVVVDFTQPESVFANAKTIILSDARPVIGTTGLLSSEIDVLMDLARQRKKGGIIAPNFCISAILMMQFSREASRYLPDVEIIEMHHAAKRDAPSGTAIKTAAMIAEARAPLLKEQPRETAPVGMHSHQGIPIHAVRLPGVLADQTVIFGHPGGTLTLAHRTIDREAFMPGVRLACKKVVELDALVYGLEHVLDLP